MNRPIPNGAAIYHLVPGPMLGDTLYPLNHLKRIYPEFNI